MLLFLLSGINDKQKIENILDRYIETYNIPAIGVSIINQESDLYVIRGERKLGSNEKVEITNKFHLGSNTKAITAFVAMKMVENNQLDFNVKVFELFPELLEKSRSEYHQITLADLFQHSARIRPYTDFEEFDSLPTMENDDIITQRYKFMSFVLTEEPVDSGSYSNAGLVIAAHILEKISGKSFEQLLEETMTNIDLDYCLGFPNRIDTINAWGHTLENDSMISLGPNHDYTLPAFILPAGDVAMDLVEYSSFIRMHFKGLLGEDNYLSSDSYHYLHYGKTKGEILPEGKRAVSTFGWGFLQRDGIKITTHTGSAGTYYCQTMIIPEKDLALIIMTNSSELYQEKALSELRKELTKMFIK